jgi:hypothetical protein
MTPIRASMVGPSCSATNSSASIAACHSSASCSALGSFVMYCAASRSVTSGFRPGNVIGSKNCWSHDTKSPRSVRQIEDYFAFTFFLKRIRLNSRAFFFTDPTCRPSDLAISPALTFFLANTLNRCTSSSVHGWPFGTIEGTKPRGMTQLPAQQTPGI